MIRYVEQREPAMPRLLRHLTIAAIALVLAGATPTAMAVPISAPNFATPGDQSLIPVDGLLCGSGWHWSFAYFKCERNRHRCPAGEHWISLIRTCVGF